MARNNIPKYSDQQLADLIRLYRAATPRAEIVRLVGIKSERALLCVLAYMHRLGRLPEYQITTQRPSFVRATKGALVVEQALAHLTPLAHRRNADVSVDPLIKRTPENDLTKFHVGARRMRTLPPLASESNTLADRQNE